MNKFKLAVTACFISSLLSAQSVVINDPNAQVRAVESFSSIQVSGGIDLYLSQADKEALAISTSDDGDLNAIKTVVENGVLIIKYVRNKNKVPWHSSNKKYRAYVSFRQINQLSASGACKVFVEGEIKAPEFKLYLSGASDFKGKIIMDNIYLNQSGASDVTVSGSAKNLSINASGASEMQGYNLQTENCTVKASGASTIKITVNKELFVNASGASSIQYAGTGVISEIKSNGASKVNKKS